MPIPALATTAGKIEFTVSNGVSTLKRDDLYTLLVRWQHAVNQHHYGTRGFTHPADQVHGFIGAKYVRFDIGSSGAFMIDIDTGIIYGIKGYGKIDKKKVVGNAYDPSFKAEALVRDRFRYGSFDNCQDGTPREAVKA